MMIWILFLIIAIIALVFATVTDLKTREVPNWLTYSLVILGLGIRFIYSLIFKEYDIILYGVIGFLGTLIFANLMYYTRQWGGGDCKLLMGLGALFGNYQVVIFNPNINLPFLIILIFNIFIMGSLYGIFYGVYLAVKNYDKFKIEWKRQKHRTMLMGILFGILMIFISIFLFEDIIKILGIVLGLALALLSFILSLLKAVENSCMYKKINVNKLTEGDWLSKNIIVNKKIIVSKNNPGLSIEDIQKLKRYKIKNVVIKEGMPFVPGFLLGFLLTIIFGNILF